MTERRRVCVCGGGGGGTRTWRASFRGFRGPIKRCGRYGKCRSPARTPRRSAGGSDAAGTRLRPADDLVVLRFREQTNKKKKKIEIMKRKKQTNKRNRLLLVIRRPDSLLLALWPPW